MHPNRIFAALRSRLRDDAIGIADGGDILSFTRLGLATSTYLDAGAFGCLGVGVPFANAAALAFRTAAGRRRFGDGAFGCTRWRSTRRRATVAAPSSSSRTMRRGTSSASTRH
jgi:thiamine pyrophosphate-dependent acetolactate synthase large subunit-like protein